MTRRQLPSKPAYTCGTCNRFMCTDCLLLASEHEHLRALRSSLLIERDERIEALERELALVKRESAEWKQFCTAGFAKVMIAWMESEVWKAATKPEASAIAKRTAKLVKETRNWLTKEHQK
ncbi:MAG: hypothetical protein RBJ76_13170 [Stenomitos frigidus ULC029]